MRKAIVDRQVKALSEHGFDAMVSCSPENYAYATGFVVPSQPLIRHRHAMVIVTADARTQLFSVDMEASTVKRHEPDVPTRIWAEFSDDPMRVLADQLKGLGLARSRIGIEMDYLPAGDLVRLQAALPEARFERCEQILARLRQIKIPDEIALLRRLSRIADQAITDALGSVKAGDSEMDIAGHLTRNVYALGAEHFKLMIIATGERSQLPNVGPTERRLQRRRLPGRDLLGDRRLPGGRLPHRRRAAGAAKGRVDLAAPRRLQVPDHGDGQARGQLPRHLRRVHRQAVEVEPAADLVRRPRHRPAPARRSRTSARRRSSGAPGADAVIEEGMVLGFEPLCYETGHGFGMQNKDMLLVTATGSELLSDYANTDKLLVVEG